VELIASVCGHLLVKLIASVCGHLLVKLIVSVWTLASETDR
jgi:hypothetical protein